MGECHKAGDQAEVHTECVVNIGVRVCECHKEGIRFRYVLSVWSI